MTTRDPAHSVTRETPEPILLQKLAARNGLSGAFDLCIEVLEDLGYYDFCAEVRKRIERTRGPKPPKTT